jgi:hypothetical protein
MGTLTALLLATPIFGFALTPPSTAALPVSTLPTAAQLEAAVDLNAGAEGEQLEGETALPAEPTEPTIPPKFGPNSPGYRDQVRKRAKLAKVHRTLGIATWAAVGLSVIAGTIQYRNLYGAPFVTNLANTPCVKGDAWISQNQCQNQPWFHAITGFTAGALYFTTLSLAIAMPDPDRASEGNSKYAKTVRTHKILRWVHLAGMVTQIALGIVIANPRLGLDRANDYSTLKLLSGIHLGSGFVTLGALSWAGTIMLR